VRAFLDFLASECVTLRQQAAGKLKKH